ncbi:MAG: diguanylate cyclase, partial [Nocardioidaceae bacterium]|nr:diguanylate cyclase [Nocardioidaceae bacterium]
MAAALSDASANAVLDALPDATAVLDRAGSIVAVNHAWRMFALDNGGVPAATGVGVNYLDLCARSAAAGCDDAGVVAAGLQAVLAGDTVDSELEYPCPSPAANRWFLLRITPLAGPTPGAVASHVNITRRKMAENIVAHEAAHDPLTGLANRTLFTTRLTEALTPRSGRRDVADVGLLYLDLDGFKPVNDTHGHDAGDEVLVVAAHRLRQHVRPQDTVARLGGDEFAVTAPRITAAGLTALAARLTHALA